MTILLTGAGGFLGLNLIEALQERDLACVALTDHPLPPLICRAPRVVQVLADVRDRAAMQRILRAHDVTCIIHAAAVTLAPGSRLTGAETAFDVNTVSTAILLQEASRAGTSRFIYPSSTAVYGAALYDGAPVTEATSPRPETVYGYTKLASERLVSEASKGLGLSCTIARITALFGPHERKTDSRDMMSLPFQIAQQAADGVNTVLPASLRRDWTSSRDVARALLALALSPKSQSHTYNLGIGTAWHPAVLAERLSHVYPNWRWRLEASGEGTCNLTLYDDPDVVRQPLVAHKFESEFGFSFSSPDAACTAYADWLRS